MKSFTYNDLDFTVTKAGAAWDLTYKLANGADAPVAVGLFAGLTDADAEAKAVALAKTIFPVGVKVIGPDVTHPITVGDIKYFPPDVAHPNFVHWDKDSSSFAKQL